MNPIQRSSFFKNTPRVLHGNNDELLDDGQKIWLAAGGIAVSHNDFQQEVKDYLKKYPATRYIDIYLHDINGNVRGKRVTRDALASLGSGCYFPLSVYAMDSDGGVVNFSEAAGMSEEPDCLCLPVKGSLRPCAREPEHHAQLLLTMKQTDGSPCQLEPRAILSRILGLLHARDIYPVIAAEMEFYLTSVRQGAHHSGGFHLDMPQQHQRFIDALEQLSRSQHLEVTGLVAEAESDQFELNLAHSDEVVKVCDNVLTLRRMTRLLAEKQALKASFMAKPFSAQAGSGMHFHVSLNDARGHNLFCSPTNAPNLTLRRSLAGLLTLMPASMTIVAPHVNSFRRLRKSLTEALFNDWGYNTRNAALRIPCSSDASRRIEYRLAGADANPYLVVAVILLGVLYGLDNDSAEAPPAAQSSLPLFPLQAMQQFRQCEYLTAGLGEAFSQLWLACRSRELAQFERQVTPLEYDIGQ
ncbi:glutamine synthetase catalytic region [[Enterobacter] lignolyticus SCF1]|uniref:Glutamine synthetase catalytic region n=1 Tax=Enterobacter lignolyticus (strain SCF1) TaxID=701347 RepID=E3GCS1_ENTLS|nr:glutamine synthetase catalytic region [[Enterobacter] lignolyticus SCF1]